MKRLLVIALIALLGFAAVYFLWPRTVELPKLGSIDDPQLPSITGETDTFSSGKPKLVAFYYTQCPDVCPMTVIDLLRLQETLEGKDVQEKDYDVILITLDPVVDTVDRIEQYKDQFDITARNWVFLRGTAEQTKEVTNQFKLAFLKDQGGQIVHGTTMYVLDEENQIRSIHDMNTGQAAVNVEQIAEHIETLIK
ncbi:SCO family protein [Bhargavaea massiliensis]|uniref:SCO family protein n=1 Tax=Bhargavaea massiliensis TaxID=2697500 RepID=UPI001BD00A95|nr:SCO family protein [Bhargavaea massiliensis]